MLNFLSEVHFWTTQEDVIIKHTDYGSFKYYPKKDINDSPCYNSKKIYATQRNILWNPDNKRPLKLKERLKELEEHLLLNKIVCFAWEDNKLQLLLSTGLLIDIILNIQTGDVNSIVFDKQLAAKLQVNIICDGAVSGQQIICICNDGHVLGHGGQWKEGWVLEGGPRRRLNFHNEWLAVWGKAGSEQPQPWSPLAKDHQRANLHLYWVGARGPELLAYKKTDGEPIEVIVSKITARNLIIIEQKVTQRGAVSVEVSALELVGNVLKRMSITSVPLQTQVSCCTLSKKEDRLLIGCIDGSLALLDRNRGSTRTIKASFIPTFAVWHNLGTVVAVSNDKGQLQYFDVALNSINSQLVAEDCTPTALLDISGYFNAQISVSAIKWGPKDLIIALEQGPIVLISHIDKSLSLRALAESYLVNGKVDKAIGLLLSWEFNEQSFIVLQRIVAYLMRLSMTEETAKYLQDALGSFHSPPVPLSTEIRHRYGSQVRSLTRRYFHQLVRANMFETAFLLAVDLSHHDLFMDLHYIAVKIGETEMAAAARAQASALLSRCSSEASNCSRSSCSQCSDTGESSESETTYNSDQDSTQRTSFITPSQPQSPLLSTLHNENNYLTTNFNVPNPKTYKPLPTNFIPPIDLPKLNYSTATKATYVKSPQVPQNFTKISNNVVTPAPIAATVVAPPLPNLCNNLGIPYTNYYNNPVRTYSMPSLIAPPSRMPQFLTTPPIKPTQNFNNITANTIFSNSSSTNNLNLNKVNKIVPPPLPVTPSAPSSTTSSNSSSKKAQAKVKFSDTVTAFIVPEIKRPVRPAPPSYVTNPQKELADSLPLCHPNEDYLKDFTPVRKNETTENNNSQPKIKVVHFGVV